MPEHGVELVQLLDAGQQLSFILELPAASSRRLELCDVDHQLFALGQELVQRGIDRPNRDRTAPHGLEHAVEVLALEGQQLAQRLPALGFALGENHPLNDGDPPFAEEHVLGAAQSDAARTECIGERRLIR